jgi:hemoglobin
MTGEVPTLYEWVGGAAKLDQLTEEFYGRVLRDPLLEPVFRNMSGEHPKHVAAFIGEVFGGPKTYSDRHGGHREMIQHHLDRKLTEQQRRRWIELLVDAADAVDIPDDPEFRSAFLAYVEWGSRLARLNSNLDPVPGPGEEPMPKWGWGVPGGPYNPPS